MTFLRDLRFAARQLRFAPGYSLAAIATLALAISASTAHFQCRLRRPAETDADIAIPAAWSSAGARAPRSTCASSNRCTSIFATWARPIRPWVAWRRWGSSTWTDVLDGEGEPVKLQTTGCLGKLLRIDRCVSLNSGARFGPDDDLHQGAHPLPSSARGVWARQFRIRSFGNRAKGAPRQ